MADTFNAQEILKIAVKVEENGKSLYESLENKTDKRSLKALWKYLKEQEEIHREVFKEMLKKSGEYLIYEANSGEYEAYLKAIASSYIFTQDLVETKTNEGFSSDLEAFDFAVGIEKESILLYSGLKEYITTDKQPALKKVIDEEKIHLVRLTALRPQMVK